ncbi:hypothetical protein Pla52o_01290 [Novipirellula galeiformis]|uniref:Uncharacterized protein n=1 Tax=Novipirellula galeiformis TaxID=2528004 RepID=A0A5C6CTA1_9BACT|nr:right-handed parallel beta-helix repeat-containing protein [Novipirellula galeiformis]TWU26276.1 hypothetical protein Pla52o_01290 [Novipirellula galeiformis]
MMVTAFTGFLTTVMLVGGLNQSAIDEVKSGKRTEARVSWWGFDPEDSTSSIQDAINSGAKRVIIEDMGRPWVVTPLLAASDQELVFEKGVVLQAKKGEFKGSTASLLSVVNKRNVTITGYGATFRMHRDDYAKPPYTKAEWRNTLQIKGCSNVKVSGLTMAESGGDGIYLGAGSAGVTNKNIHILDVLLEDHHRQGISIITAENLLIENTITRNTSGTAPMAGIDFEPNHAREKLVNCVLRNCVSENNQGSGYLFYLPNLSAKSEPISIRLENCVARGSNRTSLSFVNGEGRGQGPVAGTVEFIDCDFSGGNGPAVRLSRKPTTGAKVCFVRCRLKPDEGEPNVPTILLQSGVGDQGDFGGVHFEDCVIEDPQQRPVIKYQDAAGDLKLVDVSGRFRVRSGEKESSLEITPDWLDKLHPGNRFKRFPKYETAKTEFIPLETRGNVSTFAHQPWNQRRWGTLVLYAQRGSDVKLTLSHLQVGSNKGQPIVVKATAPGGETLSVGEVPFQSEASLSFVAPETGLYRIPIQCGLNKFQLLSSNVPALFGGEKGRMWFIHSRGDLYFYVPAGTKAFGVKVFGEGTESVGAAILNPKGTKVWENSAITVPEQYVGAPASGEGEIWTLRISKPASGTMEDYFVELQGIPPWIATDPSSLLRPSP